jgi:hypothetical protein
MTIEELHEAVHFIGVAWFEEQTNLFVAVLFLQGFQRSDMDATYPLRRHKNKKTQDDSLALIVIRVIAHVITVSSIEHRVYYNISISDSRHLG